MTHKKTEKGDKLKDLQTEHDKCIAELNDKVLFLETQLVEQRDIAMHALADLDNARKRMIKERADVRNATTVAVVESIFPVLDNFEFGIESAKKHGASEIISGFQMVCSQLKNVLENFGVMQINPAGEDFDATKHDCIRMESSDCIDYGKIISVVRSGYVLNGKIVRPASVIISSGKQSNEQGK